MSIARAGLLLIAGAALFADTEPAAPAWPGPVWSWYLSCLLRSGGVGDRAKFRVGDLFKTDISSVTVVTLYLLPTINAKLRPQLSKQLKVGTRVLSQAFDMGAEWPAAKTAEVGGRTI